MSLSELTLRQQAVWHLWGVRRVPVEEIAALFSVTPRTICRDLAAARARGWRRPRAKDTPTQLSLELVVEARAAIDGAFRAAYEELPKEDRRPYLTELLAGLRQAAQLNAELALAASELVKATEKAQRTAPPEDTEAIRQELGAALATMLGWR